MTGPAVLLGTHTFAGGPDAMRRQAAGVGSLQQLRGVQIVNVQFESDPHHVTGLRTLACLRSSSVSVTGRRGVRKPLMSEIFEALAATAEAQGLEWFCFTNGDIIFSQRAADWILAAPGDGAVLSRQDFDPAGREPPSIELAGADVFAIRTRWWKSHRRLFRGYLAGDGGWDNVYTAILLCHARGVLENRVGLVGHERHSRGPMIDAAFGEYTRLQSARDALYFRLWCHYWDGLGRLRAAGADEAAERALAAAVFVANPSARDRIVQFARAAKARVRYELWRRRTTGRPASDEATP
jgi:hypothetical protein